MTYSLHVYSEINLHRQCIYKNMSLCLLILATTMLQQVDEKLIIIKQNKTIPMQLFRNAEFNSSATNRESTASFLQIYFSFSC